MIDDRWWKSDDVRVYDGGKWPVDEQCMTGWWWWWIEGAVEQTRRGGFNIQLYTIPFSTIVSKREYSGTIAAYVINASKSGSATFANPTWASASPVASATTGVNGVGVVGVTAPVFPFDDDADGTPPLSPGGITPRLPKPMSGVVYAVEGAIPPTLALLEKVSAVEPVCVRIRECWPASPKPAP